jgi:hypothetical protein
MLSSLVVVFAVPASSFTVIGNAQNLKISQKRGTDLRKRSDIMNVRTTSGLLGGIGHAISPLILIWSLNTLFDLGIPYSFKTWLAGLLLLYVIRFHMRVGKVYEPRYVDYFVDDEEDDTVTLQGKAEESEPIRRHPERAQKAQKRRQGRKNQPTEI